ncbi:MAG: exopolyphosphatase [Bacteroidetes bacterium]|nr:exopolyphosphatase [Bacteroidota bacterium]MBS1975060.1 exopolyphosphatase [Bacteroidota bacterium]
MKLAAIDIGSNAARLLISEVDATGAKPEFNKLNLVRVPLRLGFDVFEKKEISQEKADMIISTIKAYRHLIDAYHVDHLKAAATSAMRDASNSKDIIERVKKETGIQIEIISGGDEASLIYENHIAENMDKDHAYLYIDVGGGSTELTFFAQTKLIFKESFNIGTIRILKNQVSEKAWEDMKDYIKKETKQHNNIIAIGSGGNINKVFSMSKKKDGKPLPLELLKDYHKELSSFPLAERIKVYNMREDRADVIVPALLIYINVMRWANAEEIFVPKIGLADGLIQHLYNDVATVAVAKQ